MKNFYILLCFVFMSSIAFAQNASVSGTAMTKDGPAIGAVVKLEGTNTGVITDLDGNFLISDIIPGSYNLVISSVGYEESVIPISLSAGQNLELGGINLTGGSLALQGVEIIADVALDRKTPVAVSNIDGDFIAERTGNQDITAVMSVAPSTFASTGTGGFGDSRITVRGFDDRNVVVMVNGVPVNDMENQALFWSNWAGLADVASKIQIQRGLGASMLAVPSIGGTVNIITKGTDIKKGGWASASMGNDMFRKYGVQLSTGNMDGFAITFNGTRTVGDGYVDGNFIDAYSWFGSISKDWDNHSLILTGFGAPQRHGQGFRRSLSTFVAPDGSGDYASFIDSQKAHDFDRSAQLRDNATGSANSIRYNSGWGYIDREVNNGFTRGGVFNQFSNFYHKPQVSLSHYWTVDDRLDIVSSGYGSWGRGGGASDWSNFENSGGHRWFNYQNNGGPIDWSQMLANNVGFNPDGLAQQGTDAMPGDPFYFFRASMNHHNYYGLLSKAIYEVNENVTFTGGIDGRTYAADHVRKIIDMFGLRGYQHNDFGVSQISVADDSVFGYSDESLFNRDNTGYVNWLGAFGQLEYSNDQLTAALGASASNKSYKKEQRVAGVAGESDWYDFWGGAIKGGANYNINDFLNVYGNVGYLEIQPIFDNVFLGGNNGGVTGSFINEDAPNEKVFGTELGAGLSFSKFAANLNLYRTSWQDKAVTVTDEVGGELIFGNAFGIDALHQGIELDLRYQPAPEFDITGALSIGDWTWQNNGTFQLFDQQGALQSEGGFFVEDVKVGNAPQSQFNIAGNYSAPFGLGLFAQYQHNMDYYTLLEVEDRSNPNAAGVNSNKLPDFGVMNAGIDYTFKISPANSLRFDLNFNNVLDNLFIVEAREGFDLDANNQVVYDALYDLTGNFGLGRTWNSGVRLIFGDSPQPKEADIDIPMPAPAPVADMDADDDGLVDAMDKCPNIAGTVMGCPDSDGDGVIDSDDDCPSEAGLATNGGCPEMMDEPEVIVEEKVVEVEVNSDSDGDGVVDTKDNCPDVAGEITNYGCPVVKKPAPVIKKPTVDVVERLNFVARSILFNTGSAQLRTESQVSLNEIASTMASYPNTDFIIEGHTDNTGSAELNRTLSQKRAQSVVDYLVNKGINRGRLSAIGYGEDRPIASNDTAAGRQQNRRVVIKVK